MDFDTDEILVREVKGVTVVRFKIESLTGGQDVERISAEIDHLIDGGTRKVLLDFKYVRYAASAALGMIIGIHKKLGELGGRLVLSHTEYLGDLLRISRTDKLFSIAPDPTEAMKMF